MGNCQFEFRIIDFYRIYYYMYCSNVFIIDLEQDINMPTLLTKMKCLDCNREPVISNLLIHGFFRVQGNEGSQTIK